MKTIKLIWVGPKIWVGRWRTTKQFLRGLIRGNLSFVHGLVYSVHCFCTLIIFCHCFVVSYHRYDLYEIAVYKYHIIIITHKENCLKCPLWKWGKQKYIFISFAVNVVVEIPQLYKHSLDSCWPSCYSWRKGCINQ